MRKQSWAQVVDSTVVLTTDHSGLHNNLVHTHRPPRHPGGAIPTRAYPIQCQLWPLKWYTPLAPAPRAVSPNCPGAPSDTGPVQPISAPEVSSLIYFGSCSDVGSWSNLTSPLKALVQKQSGHPGTWREPCSWVPPRQPAAEVAPRRSISPSQLQPRSSPDQQPDGRFRGLCLCMEAF